MQLIQQHSEYGVTEINKNYLIFKIMESLDIPLLIHREVEQLKILLSLGRIIIVGYI